MSGWLAAVLLFSGVARAQCIPPPAAARTPTVRLEVVEPRLVYRHDLDLRALARYTNTFETAPQGWVVLGLTRRNDEFSVTVRSLQTPSTDGRLCIWPQEITARIGGPDMDVFVAANYDIGTCEYNVVLSHENQHVAINQSVLHDYAGRIGARLRDSVQRLFPMITANKRDVQRLPALLADSVQPVFDGMIAELKRRNGALDTPEQYRLSAKLCEHWFPKLPAR